MLYIDIKNFKKINEIHGHVEGDKLLVEFSLRCKGLLKSTDFIARIGGDEFAIIFQNTESVEEGKLLGKHLFSIAHLPFYTQAETLIILILALVVLFLLTIVLVRKS